LGDNSSNKKIERKIPNKKGTMIDAWLMTIAE
jgi:hypothetical protein